MEELKQVLEERINRLEDLINRVLLRSDNGSCLVSVPTNANANIAKHATVRLESPIKLLNKSELFQSERMNESRTQIEIRESEQFIDSVAANLGLEPLDSNGHTQVDIQELTGAPSLDHSVADLIDGLPRTCVDATGLAGEPFGSAFPGGSSCWYRNGARPKASTPAGTWSYVVRRRGKSNGKSRMRAPVFRSPPELVLQNSLIWCLCDYPVPWVLLVSCLCEPSSAAICVGVLQRGLPGLE
ncbi:hypothetical protein F2P79_019769 [Pimephales promelas]|nr:hypothetical protein F2P79_019769 [Pimephales promelas]